jgi:methylmalonyl-CoA/ethylmalonyl-CoA epimerase
MSPRTDDPNEEGERPNPDAPGGVRIDHVGIAVHERTPAEQVMFALGARLVEREEHSGDPFEWALYRFENGCDLELIYPTSEESSFLTEFLQENGPGLHHLTLAVANMDAAVERVEAAGFSVLDRQQRAGWEEAFVSPRNPTGVLFQLVTRHAGEGASDR